MNFFSNALLLTALLSAASPASARGTDTHMQNNTTNNMKMNDNFDNGWDAQNSYWRDYYPSSTYYNDSRNYSTYEPAYRYGYDLYNRNAGKTYDDLNQDDLQKDWNSIRGNSNLDWNDAQEATRDAYNRMYEHRKVPASNR